MPKKIQKWSSDPDLTQEERNQKYLTLVNEAFEAQTADMTAEEKAVRAAGVEYETNVVTSTNMSEYFLLDHDIVRRAVEKGGIITKTGRGSAPSCYTNSLLGLSSIQPLPKEILTHTTLISASESQPQTLSMI